MNFQESIKGKNIHMHIKLFLFDRSILSRSSKGHFRCFVTALKCLTSHKETMCEIGDGYIFRNVENCLSSVQRANLILLLVKWPNYKPLNKSEFLKNSCSTLMIVVLLGPIRIQPMVIIRFYLATCIYTFFSALTIVYM